MATVFGCVNNTIKLVSGAYFDLAAPEPDQIDIRDIAGALSKICRFGGHCRVFYSVAEHLIHCKEQAKRDGLSWDEIAAIFLHDATEAYVGDMVKPLKIMLPQYQEIEARVEAAIAKRFRVDFVAHEKAIKKIDHEMLIAERREMFGADNYKRAGEDQVRPIEINFECWGPAQAEVQFLMHAKIIT